ncbi:MAG: phage tail sheath family protein [Richelia sp. CSU_2_1]|nr:phage tail sheath family protein [Richelia sp. CSU_2_1]
MPTYLSPGVYVEEISSGIAPIAGVGTSTAGFIGAIAPDGTNNIYKINLEKVEGEKVGTGDGEKKTFDLSQSPVSTTTGSFKVKVGETENTTASIVNADRKSQISFTATTAPTGEITVDYQPIFKSVEAEEVKLCTNFGDFKKFFGDFSNIDGQNTLAHAVYGFFNNGGTRCYVVWVTATDKIATALNKFEAIDEIAIVAAPGIDNIDVLGKIKDHCTNLGDRVAILDSPKTIDLSTADDVKKLQPFNSNYAALYFPWIQVFDPATKGQKPVPPSGHMAGIYARVDNQRGVHKAPANEVVMGALGMQQKISKNQQDGLNPQGINCIRDLNGNIRVWGARTLGGDANGEFKYINIRRLFNYLRESIDEGTQWTVFEPNSPDLWARIRRTVTAFLLTVWRSGALFGNTPEQAFFVKCDEENNPPEVRDAGQVIIEIGVAVVKPAEFVIFKLSQWGGPGSK